MSPFISPASTKFAKLLFNKAATITVCEEVITYFSSHQTVCTNDEMEQPNNLLSISDRAAVSIEKYEKAGGISKEVRLHMFYARCLAQW